MNRFGFDERNPWVDQALICARFRTRLQSCRPRPINRFASVDQLYRAGKFEEAEASRGYDTVPVWQGYSATRLMVPRESLIWLVISRRRLPAELKFGGLKARSGLALGFLIQLFEQRQLFSTGPSSISTI